MNNKDFRTKMENIFELFSKDLAELELYDDAWRVERDLRLFFKEKERQEALYNGIDKDDVVKDLKEEVIKNILFNEHQIIVKKFIENYFFNIDNIMVEYVKTTIEEDKKEYIKELEDQVVYFENIIDDLTKTIEILRNDATFVLSNNSLIDYKEMVKNMERLEELTEEREHSGYIIRQLKEQIKQIKEGE